MPKLFVILIFATLAGCQPESEILSAEELKALLLDERKISFERFRYSGIAVIKPDETFEVDIPRLGKDTGVWWLKNEQFCTRWKQVQQGREICAVIGKLPDGTFEALSAKAGLRYGLFRFLR